MLLFINRDILTVSSFLGRVVRFCHCAIVLRSAPQLKASTAMGNTQGAYARDGKEPDTVSIASQSHCKRCTFCYSLHALNRRITGGSYCRTGVCPA